MPRKTSEETRIIHADWWSAEKNAAGEWLEHCVIRRISYGAQQRINDRWIRIEGGLEGLSKDSVQLSDSIMADMGLGIMEAGIVAMTDPDGTPMEVTPTAIFTLEPQDGDYIQEAIHELNPQLRRSEKDKTQFQGASGDRTATGDGTPGGDGADHPDGGDEVGLLDAAGSTG